MMAIVKPSDINRLRIQSLLGQSEPSPTTSEQGIINPKLGIYRGFSDEDREQQFTEPSPTSMTFDEMMAEVDRRYKPRTQAQEGFSQLLGAYPQRNKPGLARKLTAVGAGIGAGRRRQDPFETQERVLYAPYMRDVEDWKHKVQPSYQAAQLENIANANERQLAGNILTNQRQQAATESRERIAAETNRIREIRAEAYDIAQRAKAAGWKIITTGPRIIAVNTDGERRDLGPNDLSERQRIILEGEWDEIAAEARGRAALDVAERREHPDLIIGGKLHIWDTARQTYVEKMPGPEGAKVTEVGKPPSPHPRDETEAEKQRVTDRYNKHPEDRKWFMIGPNKDLIMKPRDHKDVKSDEDRRHWDRTYRAVYGGGGTTSETTTGKVRVRRKADGATGTMDANDPALKSGKYEVIK